MTLSSFIKITHRIANDMFKRSFWRPDAVCVSRRIFNDLAEEAAQQVMLFADTSEGDAQICGLMMFVDDDMPDEYYQIGYKKDFIEYFKRKKTTKRIKEGS